ncbi:MAG TPA: type II secretion system protein [Pyrinomonadaceae bacterium]|nr:type II secretion system protein [Pyrinomonadaceae bacterium]
MLNGNWQYAAQQRGDWVNRVKATGRRIPLRAMSHHSEHGFSLLELVITITVLTILTLGAMPLVKVSVKRQREQRLRETLRQIRSAIDEFHRDTVQMNCAAGGGAGLVGGGGGGGQIPQNPQNMFIDPRSRVMISDCTIFGIDNPDRYPPDLETLTTGVNVVPRGGSGQLGGAGLGGSKPLSEQSELSTKQKVYLRGMPIDPMTGKSDWKLCSSYDTADCESWGGENVFDVRSNSKETALNGERYSDW